MSNTTYRTNHPLVQNKKQYDGPGVYIGRPSPWGNPFAIGLDGTRSEVLHKYAEWFLSQNEEFHKMTKRKLKGQRLVCWCRPFPCHGDFLAEWVNES